MFVGMYVWLDGTMQADQLMKLHEAAGLAP